MVCEYRAVNTMQECYSCHNYFRKDLILTFVSLYVCFEEFNCIVFFTVCDTVSIVICTVEYGAYVFLRDWRLLKIIRYGRKDR